MKRGVIATAAAVLISATLLTTSLNVSASGLTQAGAGATIEYGTLSKADKDLLRTFFDYEYYKANNPKLLEKYDDNADALFEHFCNYGIFEGRTCNSSFDPSAYAALNRDLSGTYRTDIVAYYIHYITKGHNEDRPAPTLAECAKRGVNVVSLADSSIVITPEIYNYSVSSGTTSYKDTVSLLKTAAQNNTSGNSNTSGSSGQDNSAAADDDDQQPANPVAPGNPVVPENAVAPEEPAAPENAVSLFVRL